MTNVINKQDILHKNNSSQLEKSSRS